MPERLRSQMKFEYTFKVKADDPNSVDSELSRDDIQNFVNASLGMLTGGCAMCEFAHHNNSPALFCEKKKSPVNWSSPRCEYFIRSSTQTQNVLA
jgi:hypothetical protein